MALAYMNIATIQHTLHTLKSRFHELNSSLNRELSYFHSESLDNMVAGYELVEQLIHSRIQLFGLGHSKDILELNNTVLYGRLENRDTEEYSKQLKASETYFFEKTHGGIGDLIDYYQRQRFSNPWQEASSIYMRVMAQPQLFREGNHRTGALLMSYVLLNHDLPPFVLSIQNAKDFFRLSNKISQHSRGSLVLKLRWRPLQQQFATYLETSSNPKHLALETA